MTQPKQVLYTPVDMDDADFVDFERDPKMEEENAEFETFKSEMHDAQFDAKITVGKKLTDSRGRPLGRQIFECFECGVNDYTFSQLCTRIREDFGTGLYQIHGRDSKGKYKFKKTVGILAPNSTDNVPVGNDVGMLIDKFSDAMERQAMRTEQMFSKLVGPQTGGDAFTQMTSMMTAMGGMMGAMGITPQAPIPAKTLVEQLTEFKMIKELFGGDGDGGISGDDNLYSLLGKTVEAFGGPIAAALAAGEEAGQLTPEGVAALPAPEPTRVQKITEQEKHNMAMRKNIHILIQNAKSKIPPEMFALILVNNTPEDKADELFEFISAENCVDIIIQLEPAAAEYKEWFVDLRIAVIEIMAEPEDTISSDISVTTETTETSELTDASESTDDPELTVDSDESSLAEPTSGESQSVAGENGASPETSLKDSPSDDGKPSGKSDSDTASDT